MGSKIYLRQVGCLMAIAVLAFAAGVLWGVVMPHGTPDWWGTEQTSTIHQVQDSGELAVRLGSSVRYHRAGNVVFAGNFDEGLAPYTYFTSGTGAEVYLTSLAARSGAYAVRLTAGSDANKYANVGTYHPYPGATTAGLEVSVMLTGDPLYFEVHNVVVTAGEILRAYVRYDHATGDLYYYDSIGSWQKFDTIGVLYDGGVTFHPFKLTVDLVNRTYGRLYLDDDSWDLSAYELSSAPSAASDQWGAFAQITGPGGANPYVVVDDLILTQNEP